MTRNDQIAQMIGNDRPCKDAECADAKLTGSYTDKAPSVKQGPPPQNTPQPFASIRRA